MRHGRRWRLHRPGFAGGLRAAGGPLIVPQNGPAGAAGTGAQGVSTTGFYQLIGGASYPSAYLYSVGGAGGTGYPDSGNGGTTGPGGRGGDSGLVNVELADGAVESNNVASPTNPNAALWILSMGGAGGTAGKMQGSLGYPGMPGAGGDSGGAQFNQQWNITSSAGWNGDQAGTTAVLVQSIGGAAGEPLDSDGANGGGTVKGANGNVGGNGGAVTYNVNLGSTSSQGSAIVLQSMGGQGGDGTVGTSDIGKGVGGDGGQGGNGGNVTATLGGADNTDRDEGFVPNITAVGAPTAATGSVVIVDKSGNTAKAADVAAGVLAQSIGGLGGAGGLGDGSSSSAGAGGAAGSAGSVSVLAQDANISTTGFAAAGIVAQSIGGAGGDGSGAAGIFYKRGGNGGAGGAAGAVNVQLGYSGNTTWPADVVSTQGTDSIAVIAQSIGGGGGVGGAVEAGSLLAGVAIGGNGEDGGAAGTVNLSNGAVATSTTPAWAGDIISTRGANSSGLVAQSIGGGGGTGGSAQNTNVGAFNYTVGGNGGNGGSAGTPGVLQVAVENLGIVNTVGGHAKGIVAQAVGGGGGDGGAAIAQSASEILNVQVAVGGSGGTGGTSGDVGVTNDGQLLTNGADAYGALAQSISGGGGNGGSSLSDVLQLPGLDGVPQVTVNTSVGGTGGDGSASGNVNLTNNDIVMTAGAASHGIMAQSISNGGGNGGDASALTVQEQTGPTLAVTTSVGGNGGSAAQAGNVTASNSGNGLIWTLGDSADGIYAQSIGGGGGTGGTAKATTKVMGSGDGPKAKLTIHLGGTGGNGSSGGTVNASNAGNILTMADNSDGIYAQSIGGGGGRSIGGAVNGAGGGIKEDITVTGTSSAAGNGGAVSVTNTGNILTYGGYSAGILAQSVGGGGGKAGSGSTANLPSTGITLSKYLAASAALQGHVGTYGGVESFNAGGALINESELEQWAADYLSYAAKHADSTPDATGGTVDATLNVGGGTDGDQGNPTFGDGGNVTVVNNAIIKTNGPASAGISAQSIGGGGGKAGATAANQLQATTGNSATMTVNLGSHTNNQGDGGAVNVSNSGQVATQGDASFGLSAQSVGGGGGETTTTASDYAASSGKALQINLATGVFAEGNGGNVGATNSGSITTQGNDAVGMVAQSIGGSGGTAIVMQTGAGSNGQAVSKTNPLIDPTGGSNGVTVGSGEQPNGHQDVACAQVMTGLGYNTCGNAGAAVVSTTAGSSVSTSGRDAYGVLAQSIGGGGGWIAGLTEANGTNPFNAPIMGGNGGAIAISLLGTVKTTGDGAYGVLAQSVGGGGILGGDLANAGTLVRIPGSLNDGFNKTRAGNGGDIEIVNRGTISTSGAYAHAIFAQSIGGGGGIWATANADSSQVGDLLMGTVGGIGTAGTIQVINSGTVSASGTGSSAIYTNTEAEDGLSHVTVTNYAGGQITGNASAPAINLTGTDANGNGTVSNAGTITNTRGTAVNAQTFANVDNQAGASIQGGLTIGAAGAFTNEGYWGTYGSSTAGTVTNRGTLDINGGDGGSTTESSSINGNLDTYGTVQAHVDFYGQKASYLSVSNNITFESGSSILLTPTTLKPGVAVAIMGAGGYPGNVTPAVTDAGNNYLFNYSLSGSGSGDLNVQANAASHFANTANAVTDNLNLLNTANYLDSTWSPQATQAMAQTFARFASVGNATQYVGALQAITNEGASAASVNHVVTSNAFVERMNSCPRFDGDMFQHEHDCAWGRVISNSTDRDVASDSMGYHQSGQVFQMGGQKEVADDWFVGGSVSSDHTSMSATATTGSVGGEGWTAGLIAKHQMGDWLVSAALEGGEMTYHSTRYASFYDLGGTARGKFDVTHWGLHSRISRQFAFNSWYLKPYMDLHATRINSDGYTEQGGGAFDLKVAGSHANVLSASPMVEAGSKLDFGRDSTLQIYAGVGGAFYNQGNLTANMQLADQPGPVYFSQSSTLPKERLKTTAGVDLKTGDHWDVRLEYSGEFASHLDSDTGALKVSYKF